MTLANLSIYYKYRNIKPAFSTNKTKIFTPARNEEFDLSDGPCSISHIQDYFEYIVEK